MTKDPESLLCDARFKAVTEIAAACAVYGDLAEFGVYKGGTAVALADIARKSGRNLHLFDSWEGLSAPTLAGELPELTGAMAVAPQHAIFKLLSAGLFRNTYWRQGDLTAEFECHPLAFAHVDCDMFAPTAKVLSVLGDRIHRQGAIIVDDYENDRLLGVKAAVDRVLDNYDWHIIKGNPHSSILLRKKI